MREFVKYQNRKLYDSQESHYVSMGDLIPIAAIEEIHVTEDRTGRDLTLETLSRVLYESLRGQDVKSEGLKSQIRSAIKLAKSKTTPEYP
jgi:polyhydroxyalkanoate synthesis regulator protein